MTMPGDAEAETRARQPHAILDRGSRVRKARKIVEVVGPSRFREARRILEIGCGSGMIARTLADLGGGSTDVHAVDVVDNRVEREGYRFCLVEGTTLPYPDARFDLVVSNHVIEHVGPPAEQARHLDEIRRVLAPDGLVYLAVPNKWRLVEPHFRLPLLSWFPQALADRYVRVTRRGTHYDCLPLGYRTAMAVFRAQGFSVQDATLTALRRTLEIEHPGNPVALGIARHLPDWIARLAMPFMPTYVFVLRPDPA